MRKSLNSVQTRTISDNITYIVDELNATLQEDSTLSMMSRVAAARLALSTIEKVLWGYAE